MHLSPSVAANLNNKIAYTGLLFAAMFCSGLLFQPTVYAGGSWERVEIVKIERFEDLKYTLVVVPIGEGGGLPEGVYMGGCKEFTVHGEFDPRRRYVPRSVTKYSHLKSLAFVEYSLSKGNSILLGWIGSGFKILSKDEPCIVHSKALELVADKVHGVAVISYHGGT